MIGVAIPARNEGRCIAACIESVKIAAADPALHGEQVYVFVALDRCSDATKELALRGGAKCIEVEAGNVGVARSIAVRAAIDHGARWIASTDADTVVPTDWLSSQLAYGCDAFCGIVTVDDWQDFDARVARAFVGLESPTSGHPHIHGANLGVSAVAYQRCGGFQPLAVSEDVALIEALVATGATIAREPQPVVITSARRKSRTTGGFSTYLVALERRLDLAGQVD